MSGLDTGPPEYTKSSRWHRLLPRHACWIVVVVGQFSTTPNACSSECWISRITVPAKSRSRSCDGAIRRCPASDFISRSRPGVGLATPHQDERRISVAVLGPKGSRQTSPLFRCVVGFWRCGCPPWRWCRPGSGFRSSRGRTWAWQEPTPRFHRNCGGVRLPHLCLLKKRTPFLPGQFLYALIRNGSCPVCRCRCAGRSFHFGSRCKCRTSPSPGPYRSTLLVSSA